MNMSLLTSIAVVVGGRSLAQQTMVVPAVAVDQDALGQLWVPGSGEDDRAQTLIAESHLQGLFGRAITGLSLRRNAAMEAFSGASMQWTVRISIAPREPFLARSAFAENVGAAPIEVFSGLVSLPTSPANLGPLMSWSAADILDVQFQVPFVYSSGTLCIDVTALAIAGQTTRMWSADCAFEDLRGTVAQIGGGCGSYGGASRRWSEVAERSLVVGRNALFCANGVPGNLAILFLGSRATTSLPLQFFGLPCDPGCQLHLDPMMLSSITTTFAQPSQPLLAPLGGPAEIEVPLPNEPWVLSMTFAAQWMDLQQNFAVSNGLDVRVAGSVPTLGMALVAGNAGSSAGLVNVHKAHVIRFHYL